MLNAPLMLMADARGNIRENRKLLMLAKSGNTMFVPELHDLEPLPKESELFLLPGRTALGYNSTASQIEKASGLAVAAFAAPGHTLTGHPAYAQNASAPVLPLFAYAAAGYYKGKIWICAKKVDWDKRQQFDKIASSLIAAKAARLLSDFPHNRLVDHIINNCVRKYDCPAARNFALGRHEAPLPTSRSCNARCIGCISKLQKDAPFTVTPQCRLQFTPTVSEITEVMRIHESREKNTPIYSFGQGCEGDPLTNAQLLADSIAAFRAGGGKGTINCNTNASRPAAVADLCKAGLTSMRVSLNSARPAVYAAYYRPVDYDFSLVRQSIRIARKNNVFVSLNLLYFPGVTDTPEEFESLTNLCRQDGVEMIQWRNLNIDPAWFYDYLQKDGLTIGKSIGLREFMDKLRKECPWLKFGYFNPWLGEKANLASPCP